MATLKQTTIDGTFQLPSGTSAQRPSTAPTGSMRFNTDLRIVEWFDTEWDIAGNTPWLPSGYVPPVCSGGTESTLVVDDITYRLHKFTSTGPNTLTVTRAGPIEYLIVGGGGPGGASRSSQGGGGGGGGGGVILGAGYLEEGTHEAVVGPGGQKPTANTSNQGTRGSPSTFIGRTAFGGGAGGNGSTGGVGTSGASGGGGGYAGYTTQTNWGEGYAGQGHRGSGVVSGSASGGGGGGAGGPGTSNSESGGAGNGGTGGLGGPGIVINFDGTDREYGKGGQAGSANVDGAPPANTGQGGRGTYAASNAHYDGASGVVMIRYRIG